MRGLRADPVKDRENVARRKPVFPAVFREHRATILSIALVISYQSYDIWKNDGTTCFY